MLKPPLAELRSRELPDASFRPDIEGLRGLAILLVVLYHAGVPGFAGGYIGVDVFFVLSGYLISGILIREIESSGGVNFTRFYARRARRLLPAAILVVLVTMIASWFVYAPWEQRSIAVSGFFASTYASNLWFAFRSLDYLAANPETNPFLHTWSLSVEEQFYLVWPLLVLWASRGRGGVISRVRLLWVMTATLLLSLAASLVLTQMVQPWAFFLSPTRAWEFAAGALAFLVPPFAVERRPVMAWAGLAATLAASVMFSDRTLFPGLAAIVPVAGTAILLRAGTALGRDSGTAVLRVPVLTWMGRVSYSWYLWHWPAIVLPAAAFGTLTLWERTFFALFSLVLAAVTYALVESPIRQSRFLAPRPAWSLAMAAALTLMGALGGVTWRLLSDTASRTPGQLRYTSAAQDIETYRRAGCDVDYLMVETPTAKCTFGDRTASPSVFLFGDSHAGHWFPAVDQIAKEGNWRLLLTIKPECPVPFLTYVNPNLKRSYDECREWHENTLAAIERERPSLVFASSSYAYTLYGVSVGQWREGLAYTLRRIVDNGTRVVLIRDTPRPGFVVPTCLGRARWPEFLSRPGACGFERDTSLNSEFFRAEREVAADIDGVSVADLTDDICAGPVCTPEVNGIVKFRDSNHLTGTFASRLKEPLKARIPRVARTPQLGT